MKVYLEYFDGNKWIPADGPFPDEFMAWLSLGDSYQGYRTTDNNSNVLTDKSGDE